MSSRLNSLRSLLSHAATRATVGTGAASRAADVYRAQDPQLEVAEGLAAGLNRVRLQIGGTRWEFCEAGISELLASPDLKPIAPQRLAEFEGDLEAIVPAVLNYERQLRVFAKVARKWLFAWRAAEAAQVLVSRGPDGDPSGISRSLWVVEAEERARLEERQTFLWEATDDLVGLLPEEIWPSGHRRRLARATELQARAG